MTEPLVTAVMLTRDRPEMARFAFECWQRQTYQNKRLVILDTGHHCFMDRDVSGARIRVKWMQPSGFSIGQLRNHANAMTDAESEILIHWDDDDYSHPERIAEQVRALRWTKSQVAGYREMLFWRETRVRSASEVYGVHACEQLGLEPRCGVDSVPGEAYLYASGSPRDLVGTSLCYWRQVWSAKPFQATSQGEDANFVSGLDRCGVSLMNGLDRHPRMIARIHGGNTANGYRPELMDNPQVTEWRRAREWDSYCRQVFA